MIDTFELSKKVLANLVSLDNEAQSTNSSKQLIFPKKREVSNGNKECLRISEQEMRLLFTKNLK
ncbi:hypothetical protein HNP37_003150 [Flavobacterium nitrogenifigens]|uniref:Uncharacterized protein n=2 Tax=Flavobacterium TaxID=237 RepID=A0A7W7N7N6_9FLAO|nr:MULTISPECIES: hypothetical protein [Flavobacterium]MBB4803075.1 hypothetical protein [Flavobacterium nitrogenifigens]MBB6388033.1 hypothetical protein [Flavobacterium notoginsengisoli]